MNHMKFYYTPGACSIGIHILLEEIGLVFEAYPVNLMKGEHQAPPFLEINPKGSIPVLVLTNGLALTDFVSISWWLARTYPKRSLLPEGAEAEAMVLDIMNYAINTIHGQGFTRIFTAEKYASTESELTRIQDQGVDIVKQGFDCLDRMLAKCDLDPESFTIVDAALFYIEFWGTKTFIPLPERCQVHFQRMLQRPAVRQVLMEEGYYNTLNESKQSNVEKPHAVT